MWWSLACVGGEVLTVVAEPGTGAAPGSVVGTVGAAPVEGEFVALVRDLGGDRADDVITQVSPGNRLTIWAQPMGGGAVVLEAPEAVDLRAGAAGDLTGDGAPDLWAWDAAGPLVQHLIPGPFHVDESDLFARAVDTLPRFGGAPLAPLDANGDGEDDYVAYPYVCYGPFPDGIDPEACLQRADPYDGDFTSAGDLDGDGRPELAATLYLAGTARSRANTLQILHGANPLGAPFLEVVGGGAGALADVDGDRALDLAWQSVDAGDQPLDVAFGPWAPGAVLSSGAAGLTDPVTFVGAIGADDRRVAVVAGGDMWLADLSAPGQTTLSASGFELGTDGIRGWATGDLDGDGVEDLVFGTASGQYVVVPGN